MYRFEDSSSFRPYLLAGERVLWTGQPKQGLTLSGRDTFLIPFSLFWGAFALFWNVGVWSFPETGEGSLWFFRLFGLPFLVAGLYLIVGRFIHDSAIRKRMIYAVTDQRILVLRGRRSSKLTSLDIHRLPRLELSEHSDGTGTIAFEAGEPYFGFGGRAGFGFWVPSLSSTVQFIRIANPRTVYELIRNRALA
jgi:hypothetical protein